MEKMDKAKTSIILDQPFYATILLTTEIIKRNDIPTMATDGTKIYYNEKFVEKLSVQELVFVLCHEVLHIIYLHSLRKGDRKHNRYNQACDYVINQLLTDDNIGVMPEGGLLNDSLVKQGEGQSERVYDLIPESKESKETGQKGGAMDDVLPDPDGDSDEAKTSQKEAEMKVKIIQAANIAKMCGKLSAGIERMVNEAVKTKVDWHNVLRNFISTPAKIDWTFAKPKRRFLAEDIYLPGMTGEKIGEVIFAVDCSGSINDDVLSAFATEIKCIIEDVTPSKVHVVYFDSKVLRHEEFTKDDEFKIKAIGGGGTAFSPVFDYCNEKAIEPDVCVFLTDLCCSDFGEEPNYPLLWVSTMEGNAPFGKVVRIEV